MSRRVLAPLGGLLMVLTCSCVDGTAQGGPPVDSLGQSGGTTAVAGSNAMGGSNAAGGSTAGGTTAAGGVGSGGLSAAGAAGSAMAGSTSGGGSGNTGSVVVSASDAATAYANFKTYFETCSDSTVRVKSNGTETVSEGIGY
ncbi:MAG TPA: hypothetical protein VGP93_04955, partial [Polyangiaceae bacterium]|nr:hypothetical protein [Polyangiaceae bacterium]